jgi:hypothetical protein
MEYEHLTAAGRWFRGPITAKMAASANASNAKKTLEKLDWYFRGGSAFGDEVVRTSPGKLRNGLTPSPRP